MDDGYDQEYEDRLFEAIRWPSAGYRLFEIGHFVGDRDWLDGVWESNCMFVPRSQLEQVGGFDESFSMAGGGYANLELYERLGSSPDVTVCTILGEGSFHQVHGGTTTNQTDAAERRRAGVRLQRALRRAARAARSRARASRSTSSAACPTRPRAAPSPGACRPTEFAEGAARRRRRRSRRRPPRCPTSSRWAFTEAVWRSLPWTQHQLARPADRRPRPTDLLAYQEIIADASARLGRRDRHRRRRARAVPRVDLRARRATARCSRSTPTPHAGPARATRGCATSARRARHDETVAAEVREIVGDADRAGRAGLDAPTGATTVGEFEAYAPLVPVGSYVVVTDTS